MGDFRLKTLYHSLKSLLSNKLRDRVTNNMKQTLSSKPNAPLPYGQPFAAMTLRKQTLSHGSPASSSKTKASNIFNKVRSHSSVVRQLRHFMKS